MYYHLLCHQMNLSLNCQVQWQCLVRYIYVAAGSGISVVQSIHVSTNNE